MKRTTEPKMAMQLPQQTPPPPPPPRRQKVTTGKLHHRNTIAECTGIFDDGNSLSLPDFVDRYQNQLPLNIEVRIGYMGESNHITLSAFDKLNIHFVKRTHVALATISLVNQSIPINSALEFSLLYNPNGNITEAMKGFTFKTMGDLLAARPLPKFVCCTKACDNDTFPIIEGELLIIKGNDGLQKPMCNVWSITSSTPKIVSLNCEGHFTTNPSFLHLYLSEYIQLVPSFFPCEVCVYTQKNNIRNHIGNLPQNFTEKVITLNSDMIETTLVASSAIPGCCDTIMEIPIDIPEVQIAVIESTDKQQTKQLYDSYNPKNVQCMKDARTEEEYDMQSQLYSNIREGFEKDGIQLSDDYDYVGIRQEKTTKSPPQKVPKPIPPVLPPKENTNVVPGHSVPRTQQTNQYDDFITKMDDLKSSIQYVQKKVDHIDAIEAEIKKLGLMLKQLQDSVRLITHTDPQDEGTIMERNRLYLSKLSSTEISDVLIAMGLQQYVESFVHERIDGNLMLELDDNILQRDLKIYTGLHRIRILKIISGQHSAKHILEGQNPYLP